jgi:uncharacterized protein YndB with AHSA1/START domain
VSVERVIAAPPEKIFDLLADPASHQKIDGSGTVRDAVGDTSRLALGSTFGMGMKIGFAYTTDNEVVEFEDGRHIAWQTTMGLFGRKKLFGGRIWRYDLEPVEGGTKVTETWDISQEKFKAPVRPTAKKTAKAMEQTLERIDHLVAG